MAQPAYDSTTEMDLNQTVELLCRTASTGLRRFYLRDSNELPYSMDIDSSDEWRSTGRSVRYAAICQIGIARWLEYHPDDKQNLPDLWLAISGEFARISQIGDWALSLWAGIESRADDCTRFAHALNKCWQQDADSCNAVELGWIIQACTLATGRSKGLADDLAATLKDAQERLIKLFNPCSDLFQRHARTGFGNTISRDVACFADQVYPILALSHYGRSFNDIQSIECASRATGQICNYQGTQGQWWWHYDVPRGRICEEYPVFSVHQHSMAPMAILASDYVSQQDHLKQIELGIRWVFGNNEVEEDLVRHDKGIIWRDVEKNEVAKLSRRARGVLSVAGLSGLHRWAGTWIRGFHVNRECRPYELGWILYAWADFACSKDLRGGDRR
jgi:hypothetical protein